MKKEYLRNNLAERIDIIFVFCTVIFGLTITLQLTYLNSSDPLLNSLAEVALGLGMLSLLGVGFTTFFTLKGNVQIENFNLKNGELPKNKSFMLIDKNFTKDFSMVFPLVLLIQLVINSLFGIFLGFQYGLDFTWELTSVLLVINAGVGEELFFTLFLTGVLISFKQEKWYIYGVCLLNVITFGVVHMQVYGSNQVALLHVLSLRVLYFWVYYKTKRPSIPMLLHCFNNFLFVKTILFPWI